MQKAKNPKISITNPATVFIAIITTENSNAKMANKIKFCLNELVCAGISGTISSSLLTVESA